MSIQQSSGSCANPQSAVTFVSTIDVLANTYAATFNPDHERWNGYTAEARQAIEVLHDFDIKPLRPLVLAVAHGLAPREASPALGYLVSVAVRLLIASSTRTSTVEVPLATAAKAVYEGTIDTAKKLQDALVPIVPTDIQFKTAFETARVSSSKFARYYLRTLENIVQEQSPAWFVPQTDPGLINLEHVLPKKPEGHWPQFEDDEVDEYTTRLGNLVLMRSSDNARLRSDAFADKRIVYADAAYELTRQVADVDEWSPAMIEMRQGGLAILAVKKWPIPARSSRREGPEGPDLNETAFDIVRRATRT